MIVADDARHMGHALRLGAQGIGRTGANPSVGCVIVRDGRVIGAARTADGGRPHAEPQALAQAGEDARGATVYVTLEPCAHHGNTPPCVEALITAGVSRVVIAATDPDPRTHGEGVRRLERAGIAVKHGIRAAEALAQHAGFFKRITQGLPLVTLKLASSYDGFMRPEEIPSTDHRIIGSSDHRPSPYWVTGEAARAQVHYVRAQHDAILTGIGTVLADDPLLTCRLPGMASASPIRVVMDTQLRLPLDSKLVRSAEQSPLWVVTTTAGVEGEASHATELREHGVTLLVADQDSYHVAHNLSHNGKRDCASRAVARACNHPQDDCERVSGRVSPQAVLRLLASEGVNRCMVEAGPTLASAFIEAGMVDMLHWYRSPSVFGAGLRALSTEAEARLPPPATSPVAYGEDLRYVYAPCSPDSSRPQA